MMPVPSVIPVFRRTDCLQPALWGKLSVMVIAVLRQYPDRFGTIQRKAVGI